MVLRIPNIKASLLNAEVNYTYYQNVKYSDHWLKLLERNPYINPADFDGMVRSAYARFGRIGIGPNPNNIDQAGYDYQMNLLTSGQIFPIDFNEIFNAEIFDYIYNISPNEPSSLYVKNYLNSKNLNFANFANKQAAYNIYFGGYKTNGPDNATPLINVLDMFTDLKDDDWFSVDVAFQSPWISSEVFRVFFKGNSNGLTDTPLLATSKTYNTQTIIHTKTNVIIHQDATNVTTKVWVPISTPVLDNSTSYIGSLPDPNGYNNGDTVYLLDHQVNIPAVASTSWVRIPIPQWPLGGGGSPPSLENLNVGGNYLWAVGDGGWNTLIFPTFQSVNDLPPDTSNVNLFIYGSKPAEYTTHDPADLFALVFVATEVGTGFGGSNKDYYAAYALQNTGVATPASTNKYLQQYQLVATTTQSLPAGNPTTVKNWILTNDIHIDNSSDYLNSLPDPNGYNDGVVINIFDSENTYQQLVIAAYARIGRVGIGPNPDNIDQAGYDYWLSFIKRAPQTLHSFNDIFDGDVESYILLNPNDPISIYTNNYIQKNPLKKWVDAREGSGVIFAPAPEVDQSGRYFYGYPSVYISPTDPNVWPDDAGNIFIYSYAYNGEVGNFYQYLRLVSISAGPPNIYLKTYKLQATTTQQDQIVQKDIITVNNNTFIINDRYDDLNNPGHFESNHIGRFGYGYQYYEWNGNNSGGPSNYICKVFYDPYLKNVWASADYDGTGSSDETCQVTLRRIQYWPPHTSTTDQIYPLYYFSGSNAYYAGIDPRIVLLFKYYLFREPDETGAKYWQSLLDSGAQTYEQIKASFASAIAAPSEPMLFNTNQKLRIKMADTLADYDTRYPGAWPIPTHVNTYDIVDWWSKYNGPPNPAGTVENNERSYDPDYVYHQALIAASGAAALAKANGPSDPALAQLAANEAARQAYINAMKQ
jgi:hypothetical protein